MTSMSFRQSRWTRILLLLAGLLVSAGAGGAAAFYWIFLRDLPDPHGVADYHPSLASTVFDRTYSLRCSYSLPCSWRWA